MRTAMYARVSTPFSITKEKEKEKQKQDINNQLNPLLEFIHNKKWVQNVTYLDYASGKNTDKRPQFQKMMKDAFQAKFDCLIVWKIDRLARSMTDFFKTMEELKRLKIRFIAITQNIDTDENSPTGRLLVNIMASFAEFERELIKDRINASIANRRAKGEPLGRKRVDTDISSIIKMREAGLSIRYIAEVKGINKNVVMRRLQEHDKANSQTKAKDNSEIIIETFQENN
jgi:putative DNA-invertase from lambdoid prophage Rac